MVQNDQLNQNADKSFTKEDAYKTLSMINMWVTNIDTKISFSLTLTGVLIGFIFNKGMPNAWERVSEISKLAELSGGEIIAAILVSLVYIVSFISLLYFMLAVIARIKNPNNVQSVFFFGSIGMQELPDYIGKINKISEEDIIKDLEEQIHINSMICSKKAKYYNMGVKFLMVNIILSFICMTFRLI